MSLTKPKGIEKRKLLTQEKNSTMTKKARVDENESDIVCTGFKDLSDEIMIKIIEYLPMEQWASLERINHQFQNVAFQMWRSVKEINFQRQLIFKKRNHLDALKSILKKLVLRAPNIKSIGGFFQFTKKITKYINGDQLKILAQFPALERVSFDGARISVHGMATFLAKAKNRGQLKELDLRMVTFWGKSGLLQPALDPNSNLPIIKFDMIYSDVIGLEFSKIINVSELTTLHFNTGGNANSVGDFIELIGRCTQLRHLDLTITLYGHQTNDHIIGFRVLLDALKAVATMPSENLSILKLRSSENLKGYVATSNTNNELMTIIRQIGRRFRLSEFLIDDSYWANDATVLAIADNLIHLKLLELSVNDNHCKSESLLHLVTKMTQLEKLKLHFRSEWLYDAVIMALATNLTKLQSLEIMNQFGNHSGNAETFACLSELSELKNLYVYGGRMSKSTIKGWTEAGMKFESLELPSFSTYDEEGFIDLIKTQDRSRRLDLSGTGTSITDASLNAIASSCPLLNYLNLSGCSTQCMWTVDSKITLEGVQSIVDGCTMLKLLLVDNELIIPHYPLLKVFFERLKIGKYRKIKLI